ncbi:MAG: methyltransferase domain-containing protein [bacterium]
METRPFPTIPKFIPEDIEAQKVLIEASYFSADNDIHIQWEKARRPIALAITKPGTILDFGCANSYLGRCLQEWTGLGKGLDVYGMDNQQAKIEESRELFPDTKDHFATTKDTDALNQFPKEFDYVYWNIWTELIKNWNDQCRVIFDWLFNQVKPGGKIILGFYKSNLEDTDSDKVINKLKEDGFDVQMVADTEMTIVVSIVKQNPLPIA